MAMKYPRFILLLLAGLSTQAVAFEVVLDPASSAILRVPTLSQGTPAAGKRVVVTPAEYAGTQVFHTLYLPPDWKAHGSKLPIIFEYTGNYFPQSGSTGEPEDAGLGYGLSGGRYIWVSLPYISKDHQDNEVTWWGDVTATVEYAKRHVPRIIQQYNADPNRVFLCGFSRGAIGVNYIGLHDDQIAKLWSAFVTHDHFDGVKEWKRTGWGSPLEKYRERALARLQRVGDRPYLVSQNGSATESADYIRSALPDVSNFRFNDVRTDQALGNFPNEFAKAGHTDRWLSMPSPYRARTWMWINGVAERRRSQINLGELVFEDQFERTESQEQEDEPGNGWKTSSDKTAGGHKQVDLREGTLHVDTHATANHATSVRHAFCFRNGTIALRFRLPADQDRLKLNFADLACKTVHAGHLFNVVVSPDMVTLHDRKTGDMNLKIRKTKSAGTLTDEQKALLATKQKSFSVELSVGTWHEVYAHVDGNKVSVELNGESVAGFSSEGFAHQTKSFLRLLVPHAATVDDVRMWRR